MGMTNKAGMTNEVGMTNEGGMTDKKANKEVGQDPQLTGAGCAGRLGASNIYARFEHEGLSDA